MSHLKRPGLFHKYELNSHAFDEWFASHTALRPHCIPLAAALERLGSVELLRRRESARRILRDHGINFDDPGNRQGLERPWDLDLLPLPISPNDFDQIERGLQQRNRLLDALLADCYGPQRLIHEGLIPASLLHANPGFLHALCQHSTPNHRHLVLSAADLGRSSSGDWYVISDHTQAPDGTGYALENRLVLLRVLPEEFRTCQVRRLAAYFQYQRDTLSSAAPDPAHPNVVVLTPGPTSPHYFEHAYLARYLALPLVEDADLTIRQSKVFLKTLEGLQPVDVILRRTLDAHCDPLELGGHSGRGVPGLLQAIRSGSVTIINPLGSGLAEAPAWSAFLPAICRRLLNQDLLLPSVTTHWCGHPADLDHVVANLDQLIIRRAFHPSITPLFPARMNPREKSTLLRNLQVSPQDYVGQPPPPLSLAPAWLSAHTESRRLLIRMFVCHGPDGPYVMPGGLTRLLPADASSAIAASSGAATKDTWILSETPVAPVNLIRSPTTAARLEKAAAEVPSRVADNLFWLGRYAERLEDTARILRCVVLRLVGEASFEKTPELLGLVQMMVHLDLLPERFLKDYLLPALIRESHALLYESHRLGTMPELLSRLHRIAWNVRDRLSTDTWRILSKLQNDARPHSRHLSLSESLALLNNVIADLAALAGLETENMTRGHGWRFLQVGRRLERATNITTLALAGLKVDDAHLQVLQPMLEIADSTMTYRRLYFAQPLLAGVLDLLLADESNPRALAFQLLTLRDQCDHLPTSQTTGTTPPERIAMEEAWRQLQKASFDRLDSTIPPPRRQELSTALTQITQLLARTSNGITHHFFSHAETRIS